MEMETVPWGEAGSFGGQEATNDLNLVCICKAGKCFQVFPSKVESHRRFQSRMGTRVHNSGGDKELRNSAGWTCLWKELTSLEGLC